MQRNNILNVSLVVLAITTIGIRCFDSDLYFNIIRSLFFVLLTFTFYKGDIFSRKPFFFYFLLVFTIAELVNVASFILKDWAVITMLSFYICNALYISAYLCLLWHIFRNLNIKAILNKSLVEVIAMFVFGFFLVHQTIELALESNPAYQVLVSDYITMLVLLVTVVLLLVLALLDYLEKQTNYHLTFLIAVICISFSEIMQISTLFEGLAIEGAFFGAFYNLLYVIGFLLFYFQLNFISDKRGLET